MKNFFISVYFACVLVLFFSRAFAGQNYTWNPAAGSSAKLVANLRTACGTPGTVFPTSADTLVFDGSCSNANCVLDTTFNLAKINVRSNYSGSITVSGSITLTFGEGVFLGGTFNGGSVAITFTESLRINGNSFTSTSGVLSVAGDFTYKGSTFTHNSGTVLFKKGSATTTVFSGTSNGSTSLTLYKAEFAATAANTQFMIRNITVHVLNEMKLSGTYQLFLNTNTSSTIEVQGNVISSNTASVGGGTVLLLVNGTGAQTINDNQGTSISGKLPNIKINKASGTLSLYGSIGMGGSTTLEYVAGTISAGTSRLVCYYNNTLYNNSGGTMTLSKLDWIGSGGTHTVTGKIMVSDTFSTSGTGNCVINGDTLELQGNMVWNNTSSGSGGNVVYKFSGSAEQIISGAVTVPLSKVRLKKSSGDISLLTPVNITTDLKFETGYIVPDTVNWVIFNHGATATGASENSFVKGTVKKIGNSSFVFPVGKDTIFNPIAITAPSSSTDAFRAEYFNLLPPYTDDYDSLTYLSECEYWKLERTTGSSAVQVTLNWNSNSCDIYTLSTLRVARWDGTKWNNTGLATTSGNTTSGSIQTNSTINSFGTFAIGKRSPALTVNAGTDVTISLGATTIIGGSPTASGGLTPYSYMWVPAFALDNNNNANPVATPFRTQKYYLSVTDLDHTTSWDTITVTVNTFDLKTAKSFPLVSQGNITVASSVVVTGKVGTKGSITGTITATDTILINTPSVALALRHVDTTITDIDSLSAGSIDPELGDNTYTSGVYRISGNATLNDTLILEGDPNSFFVFDIDGSLNIASGSAIVLEGVTYDQVYFNVGLNTTISGSSSLNGQFLGRGNFTGTVVSGNLNIMILGYINGNFPPLAIVINPIRNGPFRDIRNFFGYNSAIAINEVGLGTVAGVAGEPGEIGNDFKTKFPEANPWIIRYPGGSDARWWRWQSGWFRGYDNPQFNNDVVSGPDMFYGPILYKDNYPLPEIPALGKYHLPTDLLFSKPKPNYLSDLKAVCDATRAIPLFDLNMESSDLGTEIGMLFEAHCLGIPVKYIELGNEMYTEGLALHLFANGGQYVETAQLWATEIKKFFPDVKIGIDCSISKGANATDRRNKWNTEVDAALISLENHAAFDALTFHIYPDFGIESNHECDWNLDHDIIEYMMSQPFVAYTDIEHNGSNCGAASGEYQQELSLLENDYYGDPDPDYDGWITEYNTLDDKIKADGTWAHTLFVAAQSLRALENDRITMAVPYCLYGGPSNGAFLDVITEFESAIACETETTTSWELGATGYATKYLAEAMKNCQYATQIDFPAAASLATATEDCDEEISSLYGWLFSDDENFGPLAGTYGVILNLGGNSITLSVTNANPQCLFPSGCISQQMTISGFEDYQDLNKKLTGANGEVTIEDGGSITVINPKIVVKPYSITILRSIFVMPSKTFPFVVHPTFVQASNTSVCEGDPVTFYLGGATKYKISPAINNQSLFTGNSVTFIPPLGETIYTVSGVVGLGSFDPQEVTIEVSSMSNIDITLGDDPPFCPGVDVATLTVDGTGLVYNWYPSGVLDAVISDDQVDVIPIFTGEDNFTMYVNATDGICYCAKALEPLPIVKPADAGEDVWVCNGYLGDPYIGANVAASVVWSPTTYLSSSTDPYPYIDTYPSVNDVLTYTVTESTCGSSDDVEVTFIECCSGTNTYDPFDAYEQGNYLTARDFALDLGATIDPGLSQSTHLDDAATITTSNEYVINGLWDINMNLTLLTCPNIKFGPQAKIFIEPNCQLVLDGCTLQSGCTYMWNGIVVAGNIHADEDIDEDVQTRQPDNGLVITNGTIISDAEIAVDASDNSRMTIGHPSPPKFLHNYEHIRMHDYTNIFNGGIINNIFDCTNFSTQMLAPHLGARTNKALNFVNVQSTGAQITDNNVTEANYGIYSENTGLIVDGGGALIDEVNIGIYATELQSDLYIGNYVIENCTTGISLEDLGEYPDNEEIPAIIVGNEITTKDLSTVIGGAGIKVTSSSDEKYGLELGRPGEGNEINSNGTYGIYLYNFKQGVIQDNTIHLKSGAASSTMFGIRAEEMSFSTDILSNVIDKQTGNPNPTFKRAISLSNCAFYTLTCNEVDNTEYGFHFEGICTTNVASMHGNMLHDHLRGIILDNVVVSGPNAFADFGDGTNSASNEFLGTTSSDVYTKDCNGSAIYYFIKLSETNAPTTFHSNVTGEEIQPGTSSSLNGCTLKITSLNDEDDSSTISFSIYPNPTINNVQLIPESNTIEENFQASILDLMGHSLFTGLLSADHQILSIDCSELSQGVYLIIVRDNSNKVIWTNKLVIVR